MPDTPKAITTAREAIEKRIAELQAYGDELAQLQATLDAMDRAAGKTAGPGRKRGPRGSTEEKLKVLKQIEAENPGITAKEIAERMGISPAYVANLRSKAKQES
jgi:response regulator of citrate/malate metabolism